GELGVALVTAGVGLGNAVGPLYCALSSETPVLLLSGDSPIGQDGQGAFQEMDQVAMTRAVTRYSARPTELAALESTLARAIDTAQGPVAGPAHLALPADLLEQRRAEPLVQSLAERTDVPRPSEAAVEACRRQLSDAARPLILLGPALNPTRQPGLGARLQAATGAAVAAVESPRGLRDPQYRDLGAAVSEADCVLALGKRCDFSLGFGQRSQHACRWTLVHADPAALAQAEQNLAGRPVQGVRANPLAFALALATTGPADGQHAWRARCSTWLAVPSLPAPTKAGDALHPIELCTTVQHAIANATDPIVLIDGGEFGQWAQALCHAPRRVINGMAGSIGGAIPAAIAASLADPAADVLVLMGDGSAGFHFMELDTAVRVGARFTLVIGNDRRWNAEHQIQLRNYGPHRSIGCELGDADYAAAARSMGAEGQVVSTGAALTKALQASRKGVLVIDAQITSHAAPAPAPAPAPA
ncbi:MAG: thiamine pyrophosphate-dependent enzyme, partial [Pseudomonadota bacterium]